MSYPDFIGIGAQKAATTWIYMCLRQHPQICMADQKEIRFFDNDDRFSRGYDWYRQWFEHCSTNELKGEYSPTYLHDPKVPERIYGYCGDVKLIVCLRDPIERLESHIKHGVRTGSLETNKLSEALKRRPDLLQKSKYYQALQRYFDIFNPMNIQVLFYEEMRARPLDQMRQLYSFLDVDQDFVPPALEQRIGAGYVPKYRRLEQFKNRAFHSLVRTTLGNRLINIGRMLGIGQLYRELNSSSFSIKYDKINRNQLCKEFYDEYHKLPQLIGREIDAWLNAPTAQEDSP